MKPRKEKSPAFQFYARDWFTATDLRQCSYAARGLWIDILCLMWLNKTQGMLNCKNRDALCHMIGGSTETLSPLIDELISSGAADSKHPGEIINRRMRDDALTEANLKQTRSKAGIKGGSKTAAKWKQNNPDISQPYPNLKQNSPKQSPKQTPNQNQSSAFATASPKEKIIKKEILIKLGEIVQMTESDMLSLIKSDGQNTFDKIVGNLDKYCVEQGKTYPDYVIGYHKFKESLTNSTTNGEQSRAGTPERRIFTTPKEENLKRIDPEAIRALIEAKLPGYRATDKDPDPS